MSTTDDGSDALNELVQAIQKVKAEFLTDLRKKSWTAEYRQALQDRVTALQAWELAVLGWLLD